MSGSTDMTLVTKEIKDEEARASELLDKLTQRLSFLKVTEAFVLLFYS